MPDVHSRNSLRSFLLFTLSSLTLLLVAPLSASADQIYQYFGAGDGQLGVDVGFTCDVGVPSCSAAQNYATLAPHTYAASGTLVLNDAGTQLLSFDLSAPNVTLDFVPGGTQYGGVDEIRFTNITISLNPVPILVNGNAIFALGLATATVSGLYTQWSGGIEVAGPDAFSIQDVALSGFACSLVGLCGVGVGASGDLILTEIGVSPHYSQEFNLTFDLAIVPEPGTAVLMMLGLAGLALRRR